MRIAFVDHSFHQKTRSNMFMRAILERLGEVESFYDDSWRHGPTPDIGFIARGGYDLTVVFQMETYLLRLAQAGCQNLVFVPMWDGCRFLNDNYWRRAANVRILSFCRRLHENLTRLGNTSAYFQYFPNPAEFTPVDDFSTLRGFFWQRRHELTWLHIRQLIAKTEFASFHVHGAIDPGCGAFIAPTAQECITHNVKTTSWFERQEDFKSHLRQANIAFAPRISEGIGMALLETMAMGMCVVAPNQPTMNEYVRHNVNGLLFNAPNVRPLDFTKARDLGLRARESIERGYERWQRDLEDRLPEYLLNREPGGATAFYDFGAHQLRRQIEAFQSQAAAESAQPGNGALPQTGKPGGRAQTNGALQHLPLVTVAVVVKNAAKTLEHTLQSILVQDYPRVELIVLDGQSSDGTLDIIKRYEPYISVWSSEPDEGPYFAMNKAAKLGSGRWILFMNAGDWFYAPDVISRAMANAPQDVEFLFGHHIFRSVKEQETLTVAADFDISWRKLKRGKVNRNWLKGLPCHQATFTNRELLRANGYDTRYRIAADHEFFYRMRNLGARLYHLNDIIAVYSGGGLSARNQAKCYEEWRQITLKYAPPRKVNAFFRKLKRPGMASLRRKLTPQIRKPEPQSLIGRFSAWRELRHHVTLVDQSSLFFDSWYLRTYPDVAAAGMEPKSHYLQFGAQEGRDPSPFFDTKLYLANNPDVREAGVNPLVHYILHGFRENRAPNAWFDIDRHIPEVRGKPLRIPPLTLYLAKLAQTPAGG